MCSAPRNLRPCAVLAAAALALAGAGCGGGERRDAADRGGTYAVDVVRAQFPARQQLGDKAAFVLTVRNTGARAIPNLAVTVHGFSQRSGPASQADARSLVWLVDEEPPGAVTAIEDTWTAGALAPGRSATLRWHVTPARPGIHAVRYAVAPDLAGRAQARLAGGARPRGAITVHVAARPAHARVDPRTGRVVRG